MSAGGPPSPAAPRPASKLFSAFGDPAAGLRFGRFTSAALERQYRGERFSRDRDLIRRVILIVMAIVLVLVVSDRRYVGLSSTFWWLAAVRVAFCAVAFGVWARLARLSEPRAMDDWLTALLGLLIVLFGLIQTTRPPGAQGFVLLALTLTFTLHLAPILPTVRQLALGVTLFVVTLAYEWWSGQRDSGVLVGFGLSFAAANLVGAVVSAHLQAGERLQFLTLRRANLIGRYFEQLIDASPNLVYVTDPQGEVLFANRQAIESGVPATGYEEVARTGTRVEQEESVVAADGQTRWYHTVKVPFGQPDGRLHVLGISIEITDRHRAEEARIQLETKMQHAQKLESLGVLAGGIAHDFNNLLAIILGNATFAARAAASNATALASIREIDTAGRRAAALTQQMLAYAGRAAFTDETVDLAAVVDDMSTLLRTVIAKKTECRLDLRQVWTRGDMAQLQQVVMNLITNASDALEGESGVVSLATGEESVTGEQLKTAVVNGDLQPGRCARLEVSDTGSGMAPETLARIFDPFFTTKFTGRGLGLAAVLGIVRRHGGAMRVTSHPGRGTTFTVWFPLVDPASHAARPALIRASALRLGTVLVVEDETQLRALMVRVLTHSGYDAVEARDGVEGVELLERHPEITAVLLDLTMPRMDGWQALEEMRRHRPSLPVILMSGLKDPAAPPTIGGGAVPPIVRKPFEPDELLAELDRAIVSAMSDRGEVRNRARFPSNDYM